MKKTRSLDLLQQMIDCIDTINDQDNLTFDSTYEIIKRHTDIEDYELDEMKIDIDYLKEEKG